MQFTSIPKSDCAYLSFEQECELHAQRHLSRALVHEANGHPDYAAGSRRKAAKWRAKADPLKLPPLLVELTRRIGARVAMSIFYRP